MNIKETLKKSGVKETWKQKQERIYSVYVRDLIHYNSPASYGDWLNDWELSQLEDAIEYHYTMGIIRQMNS